MIGWLSGPLGTVALYAAAAGLVALAADDGWKTWVTIPRLESRAEKAEGEAAKAKDAHKSAVIAATEAARKQEAAHRAIEQGWITKIQETERDAETKVAAAKRDAAAAVSASSRLRDRVAALTAAARRTPEGAPAPAECRPAIEAADLLADMQRRIKEAAIGIGSYADRERVGHESCVSSYQALEATP